LLIENKPFAPARVNARSIESFAFNTLIEVLTSLAREAVSTIVPLIE